MATLGSYRAIFILGKNTDTFLVTISAIIQSAPQLAVSPGHYRHMWNNKVLDMGLDKKLTTAIGTKAIIDCILSLF